MVAERVAAFRDQVAGRRPPPVAAVVEVPLLFEAGMEAVFDATVAVVAAEAVRSARAAARGHAVLDERAARQLSQEEKARRATFAVPNDETVEELETRLSVILGKLRS
jgi:dephospho-CoA kinase